MITAFCGVAVLTVVRGSQAISYQHVLWSTFSRGEILPFEVLMAERKDKYIILAK